MPASVRYRPAEILRWLEMGTETIRRSPIKPVGPDAAKGFFEMVGKVVREGKGAIAGIAGKQLEGLEFVLDETHVTTGSKRIAYTDIRSVELDKGSAFRIVASGSSLAIKPYAWLEVAGHRVPIGWLRDGMEVPFELLAEEIAARAGVEVTRP